MDTRFSRYAFAFLAALPVAGEAEARCEVDVSRYVGWEIVHSGTVTGYVDEDGERRDGFEGCEYDRVLIVDDSRYVRCAEYNYSYAYRPEMVILRKGARLEACIDDEMYDIRRY